MNLTEITIKTALKKMFNERSFSICTIDKLLKLSNTIADKQVYEHMSALHCVNYSEMPEELRDWLFDNTVTMFNGNGFNLELIDLIKPQMQETSTPMQIVEITTIPGKKSFMQKLIG